MRSIEITFRPQTFAAFQGGMGEWLNYEKVAKLGITSIDVRPILRTSYYGNFDGEDDWGASLRLYFDAQVFVPKLGMVYGDEQFESEVQEFMRSILSESQFGLPYYTEAGMQGDDFVSMEYQSAESAKLAALSSHDIIDLRTHPEVQDLIIS